MKAAEFSAALAGVKDEYIQGALTYQPKKKTIYFLRAAVAACLCIAILGGVFAFKTMASELEYYRAYFGYISENDNPPQKAQRKSFYYWKTPYTLTVTTDKARYTVDEYIYVTAVIENHGDQEISFFAASERGGAFYCTVLSEDEYDVRLYDATYNRFDITADSFAKDELQMITLKPGEFYSQTLRFSAKYVSTEPDTRPIQADEILREGKYCVSVMVYFHDVPNVVDVPIEIISAN